MAIPAYPWATFVAAADAAKLREVVDAKGERISWYDVRSVNAVRGDAPLAGFHAVARVEDRRPPVIQTDLPKYTGGTQHLQYTDAMEQADLATRSRLELPGSPTTAAVLIPIRKSAEWWQLAHDRRNAYFHQSGHTPIGSPYADRIFRRLYHSRYTDPASPYDFLTYFEFEIELEPLFRELLAALRDPLQNPEWRYVEAEFEVWMTKLT